MHRRNFQFLIQDGDETPHLLHTVAFELDTTAISFARSLLEQHDLCEVRQGEQRVAVITRETAAHSA